MKFENEKFQEIWDLALPYQDKRGDEGHAEIVTKFAIQLCEIEDANPDVVVPAAILHDVGWSKVPEDERMATLDGAKKDLVDVGLVRIKHQNYSVELAKKILEECSYDPIFITKIIEIISQHDTRNGFVSKDEGVMRDADKMWRFDTRSFVVDADRLNQVPEEAIEIRKKYLEEIDFFFSKKTEEMARQELKDREKEYGLEGK